MYEKGQVHGARGGALRTDTSVHFCLESPGIHFTFSNSKMGDENSCNRGPADKGAGGAGKHFRLKNRPKGEG